MHKCHCGKEFISVRGLNGHKSVHREGGRYSVRRIKKRKNKIATFPTFHTCMNCDEQFVHSRGTQNKYCSNKCQQELRTKELARRWLETGNYGNVNFPKWAKRILIELRGYACSQCGITEWNGNPITLQCDHIDGNSQNNHVDNLRLICPNCHSQTPTYGAKNKGNGRYLRRMRYAQGKSS